MLEASAEWADRLVDARIPPRYQGFDLQRIAPRLTGESDDSFVTRVEGLDRFLGAFIERSHAAMRLRRWLRLSRPRSSLWLMGPSGVGKTLFACVIGEELLRQGENVLFLPETDFFAQLAVEWSGPRPTFGILSEARGCDLLILDGANVAAHQKEPPRPWMSRASFQLVSARTNACRPIVWTSLNTIDAYADVWEGSDPADCQGLGGRIYHACGRTELELPGLNWRMTGRETDSF